jgi:hypothetical protein
MSIKIGRYDFEGPYSSTTPIEDKSGVYAVLCHVNDKYNVLDVGESATVKTRLDNHERKDCWKRNCSAVLMFAVYYTPNLQQAGRKEIEQELRKAYNPLCGDI